MTHSIYVYLSIFYKRCGDSIDNALSSEPFLAHGMQYSSVACVSHSLLEAKVKSLTVESVKTCLEGFR